MPTNPAEERYSRKKVQSRQTVAAQLVNLKATRPDIYSEQVKMLGGSRDPNIEPHKLSIPDQASIVAGALG